ncbi:MAG: hypothetical protein Kow0090_18370 [Myxococcota bacterium]
MNIISLARQTFQLGRHSKLISIGVIVGCAVILLVMGGTSIGVKRPVADALSLGLWLTMAISTILSAVVPVQLICNERHNRAIYLTLSLPVSRTAYILGRWFGCWAIVSVVSFAMLLMTSALAGVLVLSTSDKLLPSFLPVIYLQFLEIGAVTAIAVMFAAYTTPVLATLYTLAVALASHFAEDVERMSRARGATETIKSVWKSIIPIFPDMSIFDVRTNVAMGFSINPDIYLWAPIFGAALAGVAISIAVIIFQSQDVK